MKLKTQILLAVLVIFLTVGCVSAADDDAMTLTATADEAPALDLPAPTYYDVTQDTYSTYFDENGTFTVTPSAGENSVVRISNLTDKNFVFNTPNITVTSLGESDVITNGKITLNAGAEGSIIAGLTINTNGYDVIAIEDFASNVGITDNVISVSGEALYNFAAIVVHDSEDVMIADNLITINATGQYAYGIDLYTNYVENATISNAVVTGNTIAGIGDYYIAGISAMNGVTDSEITNNTILLECTNLSYGIATAKNYADAVKSGNLLIADNVIDIESDMAYGIESASQVNVKINNNKITVEGNGAEGIAATGLENSEIKDNVLDITGGTLTNSYWDSIPNDNVAIFLVGDESYNTIESNNITGVNVDGISVRGSNNEILSNTIMLTSDENIQLSSYGSSMVMGIEAPGSENTISLNDITVTGNATYNYGIDAYAPVYGETISDVIIASNEVNVITDSNYGAGIYASGLSEDNVIDNNDVDVISAGMGYGIAVDGVADSVAITSNDVDVFASDARGIEVTNLDDSQIDNNIITAIGDGVYGIVAYHINDVEINDNEIEITKGNLSEAYQGWDYVPAGQEEIYVNYLVHTELDVNPTIILEGQGANFTGLLLDDEGNPVVGHHLFVNLTRTSSGLSKVYEVVSDYNGEFQLPINLASGDYTAQVSYAGTNIGNTTYDATYADPVDIRVVKELDNRTATTLDVEPLTKSASEEANFTGTLTSFEGFPIAGQHVKVTLTRKASGASKTYDVVTDYTGTFTLPINLAPGAYTADVAYEGTTDYQPRNAGTVDITVTA